MQALCYAPRASQVPCHFPHLPLPLQARRTKKVGICGKYGTRYGATLRKLLKKIEVQQHSKVSKLFHQRAVGRFSQFGFCTVHLRVLRQGQREARRHRYLEVRKLPEGAGWRCLRAGHPRCHLRAQQHLPSSEGPCRELNATNHRLQ